MKAKSSGIYAIVNSVNAKLYVGSAVDLTQRWREHRSQLLRGRHPNRHLQSAWAKHGSEAFTFVVLALCEPSALIVTEQRFIDSMAPQYNICPIAGSTLGRVFSSETRAKIAAKLLGRKHAIPRGQEWRDKLSAVHKGKPKSAKSVEKMRATKRGSKLTPEHRAKIGDGGRKAYETGKRKREKSPEHRAKIAATLKGVTHSAERRAKQVAGQLGIKRKPYKLDPAKAAARSEAGKRLAASRRGKPLPAASVEKMRKKLKGRKLTPEHRAKIGAASLASWARRKRERPQPDEPPLLRLMQAARP